MASGGRREDPYTQRYFHGRITREEAEVKLRGQGCSNGLFLLREKLNETGSYVLSLCYNHNVFHYELKAHGNGMIAIEDGKRFTGPIELIRHHQAHLDGLLTKLVRPCNLPEGEFAVTFEGMNRRELRESLHQAANALGVADLPDHQLERTVMKTIHLQKPWFHGSISRDQATAKIEKAGHNDGKFLVREREGGSFAIGISYRKTVYHYKVDKDNITGKYSIQDGHKFDSLYQMIDHYSKKKDGLLCELSEAVVAESFKATSPTSRQSLGLPNAPWKSPLSPGGAASHTSPIAIKHSGPSAAVTNGSSPIAVHGSPSRTRHMQAGSPSRAHQQDHMLSASPRRSPIFPKSKFRDGARSSSPTQVAAGHSRQRYPSENDEQFFGHIKDQPWDDEPDHDPPSVPARPLPPPPAATRQPDREEIYGSSVSNAEKIYDTVAKNKKTSTLNHNNLTLTTQLGKGNFGSVVKGIYKLEGQDIPVAVKTLKEEEKIPNKKPEIIKEAELMSRLDHPYIVRMIGMCQAQAGVMMLVLELAELGPLNKYLKQNQTMRVRNILEILLQVAMGMQYLEGQQFVHRDLAARNVLLVTETYAKISDFGMSKALGLGSQYYIAETAGKWPLKWYAPECIYRFKFSSKGDVWSYGVTAWEAMSFGKKPYARMRGQQILDLLESGERLQQPEKCPDEVYQVMKDCWVFDAKERPDFKAVVSKMKTVLSKVKKGEVRLVQ
ncbi:tyrosine-protein kinase SYK-like isoform X1 [Ptychodera flava]|uniref:tyrosine-protein kinase SYK-like isoform X1 n=1 Tax=Ptychodera flava TaxID=63121 RepID=UPI003969DEEB